MSICFATQIPNEFKEIRCLWVCLALSTRTNKKTQSHCVRGLLCLCVLALESPDALAPDSPDALELALALARTTRSRMYLRIGCAPDHYLIECPAACLTFFVTLTFKGPTTLVILETIQACRVTSGSLAVGSKEHLGIKV